MKAVLKAAKKAVLKAAKKAVLKAGKKVVLNTNRCLRAKMRKLPIKTRKLLRFALSWEKNSRCADWDLQK